MKYVFQSCDDTDKIELRLVPLSVLKDTFVRALLEWFSKALWIDPVVRGIRMMMLEMRIQHLIGKLSK